MIRTSRKSKGQSWKSWRQIREFQRSLHPFFRLTDYGDSALNFTLRVWTNPDDFWSVKFDLLEGILESFRKNRIEIPYNQLDIHVVNGKEGA